MAFSKITVFTAVVAICISSPALAVPLVTYTWTTTSEGYGSHVDAPSLATFEAPLSDVLSGEIPYADISDIQLFYPGLTFNEAVTSSIGLDNVAYVDPTTGTSFIIAKRRA